MFLIAALAIAQIQQAPSSQPVLGAAEVLKRINAVSGDKQAFVEAISGRSEMLAFARSSAKMTPVEAADGWLKLVSDIHQFWVKGPVKDGPKSADAVTVLPPPSAWPLIAARIDAIPDVNRTQRDWVLKLLFDELNGKRTSERADLDALIPKLPGDANNTMSAGEATQLAVQLAQRSGDKSWLADAVVKNCEVTGQPWMGSRDADFVTIVGKDRARPILRKLLLGPRAEFNGMTQAGGAQTTDLLIELVTESLGELKAAPWGIACRIRGARLYPILAKHWPHSNGGQFEELENRDRFMAKVVYAVSLELAGKHNLAMAQREDWDWPKGDSSDLFWLDEALDKPEYKLAFYALEAGIAARHPEKVDWKKLSQIAKEINRTPDFLALAESARVSASLLEETRVEVETSRIEALLSIDKIDKAALLLTHEAHEGKQGDAGLHLAVLGALTGHPAWVEAGIAAAKKDHKKNQGDAEVFYMGHDRDLPELLVALGSESEAETYYASPLNEPVQTSYVWRGGTGYREGLVKLYFHANRPADVLELLEHAPGWSGKDLSDVYFENFGYYGYFDSTETPFGYYAAWALAKLGRKAEAFRVLQPTLYFARASDPGYALLLELKGEGAIPILDGLYARDRFEARPLIWKAEALRRAGRLAEAEKVARSAISIDPSDGESPAGDRLRAYAVLADVRAAQGAAEEASQLRSAVQAIRMAEHADDLVQAGLIQRGTKEYLAALTKFSDAYCIQSRLAVQLAAEGKSAEAAEHFRRAYELMPSSFGRVESHCLGCEGAFTGDKAQHIALETLTGIAKRTPNNPRVHYLIGYIYEEEKKPNEAIPEFKRAVELDPEYLNAWVHLSEIASGVDDTLADKAGLALGRLDPSGLHREWGVDTAEPAELWRVVHAAVTPSYLMPRDLMPLHPAPPSNNPIQGMGASQNEADWPRIERFGNGTNVPWRIPMTPSLRVSQLDIVSSIASLLSHDEQSRGGMGGFGGG